MFCSGTTDLRLARPGDQLAVARVHVRAWQLGYRGLLPDAYLDSLRAEDRATRYTFGIVDGPQTIVAVRGTGIVGFVTTAGTEVAALYVDPPAWRSGVGTMLIVAGRAQLAVAGATEARLWILEGNQRGLGFYARDGWAPSGVSRNDVVWGVDVKEIGLHRMMAVPYHRATAGIR